MTLRNTILLLSFLTIIGCSNIKHTTKVSQKFEQTQFAGVGDVVLSIERERNLKNAFGKSDIFGRKTKEGYTEIRFAGVEPDGTVVLYRKDVVIITNETTMSRSSSYNTSGYSQTKVTGTANTIGNQTTINARGSTTHYSTTIGPAEDYHIVVPAETIPIRLKPTEKILPVSGYIIQINSVSTNALEYRIEKQAEYLNE